jgi:PEP-CTERM motif
MLIMIRDMRKSHDRTTVDSSIGSAHVQFAFAVCQRAAERASHHEPAPARVATQNGRLDGIRVYDQDLSAAEIQSAAAASVSIPEPASFMLGVLGAFGVLRRKRR